MLNLARIEEAKGWYGADSWQFWSQRRGFFPPEGVGNTLFSEAFLIKHDASGPVQWADKPLTVAGLDPAFSTGGDRCILQFAEVGRPASGDRWVIYLTDTIHIKLEASSPVPLGYQVAAAVREHCTRRGVTPDHVAMDVTGTQGPQADIIEQEWKPGLYRVSFGGAATAEPIAFDSPDTVASQMYANRVTELWYALYHFVRHDQVRGAASDLQAELCQREMLPQFRPARIEAKTDMKKRTNRSPDLADAAALVAALVRERLGLLPGDTKAVAEQRSWSLADYRRFDVDANPRKYMPEVTR